MTASWSNCRSRSTSDETRVLTAIDIHKDVDGFHPVNVGRLMIGEPTFLPCTPAGIQELIVRSGTKIEAPKSLWSWAAAISWASPWP